MSGVVAGLTHQRAHCIDTVGKTHVWNVMNRDNQQSRAVLYTKNNNTFYFVLEN